LPKAKSVPVASAAAAAVAAPASSVAGAASSPKKSSWFSGRYKSWLWSSKPKDHSEPIEEDSNSYYYEADLDSTSPSKSVPAVSPSATVATSAKSVDAAGKGKGGADVKFLVKSLVPTSKELASLNLKPGLNHVVFSVNTGLRGVQTVSCQLFLWDARTPVVISDVDGTITRSDVPGMFLPYVGRDWSQKGVANLFSKIHENGYNMLYLTARSIGQANSTRGFISSLTQGSIRLPPGPVFMSPDRLIHALNREVVERKPEEFKIGCLESLKSIYPSDFNPFSAGFGNRPSDIHSYLAVGIPELRIFSVNPLGTVTTANVTYKKSYTDLGALVHDMFPAKRDQTAFNDAMWWSLPLDVVEEFEK
jgi:phosphatidate phosphatase LPIN